MFINIFLTTEILAIFSTYDFSLEIADLFEVKSYNLSNLHFSQG